jgi:hypothetical protein
MRPTLRVSDKRPDCTEAIERHEAWLAVHRMYRIQDRKDGIMMLRLTQSRVRKTGTAKDRHILAFIDGELALSSDWCLRP